MITDETKIKELTDWLLSNPNTTVVNDCDARLGAEFIARCMARATADSAEIVYPLSEFMQEKGIADEAEAESLFYEMFKQANRLMNSNPDEGLYFNNFDMVCIKKGVNEKVIRFCPYFYKREQEWGRILKE